MISESHPLCAQPDDRPSSAQPSGTRKRAGRIVRVVILALFLGVVGSGGTIVLLQNKMIYHPRRYWDDAEVPHKYVYNEHPKLGRQWGILIEPPADRDTAPGTAGSDPPRPGFYLYFGGNADLAINAHDYFTHVAERTGCGFLLVDYRGYGFNEGRPTEEGIVADALAAYDTMKSEGRLENGVGLIGMSLGGGVAIALAEQRAADRVIVVSSFTSVDEMARTAVPWPLWLFCWNDWPSEERIRTMMSRPPEERPAEFFIFHGRRDRLIPFEMGERLAAAAGEAGTFHPMPQAAHNDGFLQAQDQIMEIIAGRGAAATADAAP